MAEMIVTLEGKAQVTAEFRGMKIRTDQRPEAGGDGSAPEPFTLFLASIGTCAGIYVMKFCQARGIATENIRIVERFFPDPVAPGRIARIGLDIELPADFPEKYRDAVVRAANGCAVKQVLHNPFEIEVRTVTAS